MVAVRGVKIQHQPSPEGAKLHSRYSLSTIFIYAVFCDFSENMLKNRVDFVSKFCLFFVEFILIVFLFLYVANSGKPILVLRFGEWFWCPI